MDRHTLRDASAASIALVLLSKLGKYDSFEESSNFSFFFLDYTVAVILELLDVFGVNLVHHGSGRRLQSQIILAEVQLVDHLRRPNIHAHNVVVGFEEGRLASLPRMLNFLKRLVASAK